MKKAVILHGTGGSPEGNWFRWLESQLFTRGYQVWVPRLPLADSPNLAEWAEYVMENSPFDIDNQTVVIGHSSGGTLAILLAAELRFARVLAIAPFIPAEEPYAATSWGPNTRLFEEIDFEKLLTQVKHSGNKISLLYSDDDPYVPEFIPEVIAEMIDAEKILMRSQGHFNLEKSEKYRCFPELLAIILGGER